MKSTIKKMLSILLVLSLMSGLIVSGTVFSSAVSNNNNYGKYASVTNGQNYRATVHLTVGKATSGTTHAQPSDSENVGFRWYASSPPLYQQSDMVPIDATIEVDPSDTAKTSLLSYGSFFKMNSVTIFSAYQGRYRMGIILQPDHDTSAPRAGLSNSHNTVTVVTNQGNTRTFRLCDASGNLKASALTGNGDFNIDSNITAGMDCSTPEGMWYIDGPILNDGEEAKFDVIASCLVMPADNNIQMLNEWCNVTIRGKCEHVEGFNNKVCSDQYLVTPATSTTPGVYKYSCVGCGLAGDATFVQYTAEAHKYASVSNYYNYRNTVDLLIQNVTSGTVHAQPSDGESAFTLYTYDSMLYQRSDLTPIEATLVVDPSNDNAVSLLSYNTIIRMLSRNIFSAYEGRYRVGVVIQPNHNSHPIASLGNENNVVNVTTNQGNIRTFRLCDKLGNTKASAITGNGDFSIDSFVTPATDTPTPEGIWYLDGPILNNGESACFDIIAQCVVAPKLGEYQMLNQWCHFAVIGVCSHSKGFTAEVEAPSHLAAAQSCTSGTKYYKSCETCGANGTETFTVGEPSAHTWNTGEVIAPATCRSTGTKKFTCTVCDATRNESIPVDSSNHTGGTEVRDAVAASCGVGGYTGDTYCLACNVMLSEGSEISATGAHTWNTGEVIAPATCRSTGTKKFTCTVCDATRNESIPVDSSNHTGGTEVRDAVAASCGVGGYTGDTYCVGCNTKLETGTAIDATGAHAWNLGEVIAPATCRSTGTKKFTCTICDATRNESIPVDSSNHTGGTEVRDAVAASCGVGGYTGDTYCLGCNTKLETGTAIDATGAHTWNTGEVIAPANCVETGTKKFTCTVCDATRNESIPVDSSNHTGGTKVRDAVAASCGVGGYTGDTYCLGCNTKLETGTAIDATGAHTWNTGEVIAPANCVETGTKKFTCTICDATRNESIPVDNTSHKNLVTDAAVESSCSQTGLTEGSHCQACDTVIVAQTATDKKPHTQTTVQENITNATCTVAGSYDSVVKCSVCHTEISRTHISGETLPHSYTILISTTPSTCVVLGNKVMKCENCEATTNVALTEYTAHTWNAGEVIAPANCIETGTKKFTCTVCDATRNESIPVDSTNHKNLVTDAAVESSCSQTGLTEGSHCQACDTVIVAQTGTPMKPHEFGEWTVVREATQSEEGLKQRVCINCSHSEQQAIERLPSDNEPTDNNGTIDVNCKDFSWIIRFIKTVIGILKVVFTSIWRNS